MIFDKKLIDGIVKRVHKMPLTKFEQQMKAFSNQEPELMRYVGDHLYSMRTHAPKEIGAEPFTQKQMEAVMRSTILFAYQFFLMNIFCDDYAFKEKAKASKKTFSPKR